MRKQPFVKPVTRLFLLGSVCLSLMQCKIIKDILSKEPRKPSSVNLVLKQNRSDIEIKQRIIAATPLVDPNSIKIKRCPCDSTLINVALPNDWIFEGHGGDVATKPRGGGSGGGGDVNLDEFGSLGLNIEVSSFDDDLYGNNQGLSQSGIRGTSNRRNDKRENGLISKYYEQIISGTKDETKSVKVAVLDSGIDPTILPGSSWKTLTSTCATSGVSATSDVGWNFVDGGFSSNTMDDQPARHGTRVAFLTAQQFLGSQVPVKIIPMKVLDKKNEGDLFNILCALETARKNNVDIINMSLGYYGDRDSVFADYIKRSTDQGIWVITAAGNQNNFTNERKLSAMPKPFYPAMFSQENERIFAVTTVEAVTCERQNFDSGFVVGVKQDIDCRFKLIPDTGPRLLIFGTSYASPILAGWLGRSMRENPLPIINQRQKVLERMNQSSIPGLFDGRSITRQMVTP